VGLEEDEEDGAGTAPVAAAPPSFPTLDSEAGMLFVPGVIGVLAMVPPTGRGDGPFVRMVLMRGRDCEGVGRGRLSDGEDAEGHIGPLLAAAGKGFQPAGNAAMLMLIPFAFPGAVGRAFFPGTTPEPCVGGGIAFEGGGRGGRSASFFGTLGPPNEEGARATGGTTGLGCGFHPGGRAWMLAGLAPAAPAGARKPTLLLTVLGRWTSPGPCPPAAARTMALYAEGSKVMLRWWCTGMPAGIIGGVCIEGGGCGIVCGG